MAFAANPKTFYFPWWWHSNTFLMKSIKTKTGANIASTDSVVDSRYMEAFAYLAYANKGVIFR